jgi:RluA family pseudouridine synthase
VKRRRIPEPTILYADEFLLVVDKPAEVLSSPGRGDAPNLPALLAAGGRVPAAQPPLLVHRLDRGASGVMVLARTPEAQRRLHELFMGRRVEKVYWALVQGYVTADGRVDLPLHVDRDRRRVVVAKRDGKPASTLYRVAERVAGHTWLECRPMTGRLHQIRVHLAAIGHPLAVDPRYGGVRALWLSRYKTGYRPSRRHEERPLINRLTLHAARLTFDHPAGTGPVSFEAPLPKDLRGTLRQLRRAASRRPD